MNYINYTKFEQLCVKLGTTPTALSAKLGLSKGNTTSWRKGGNPSVEVLIKIADELNCTVDYLLDRNDKQYQTKENVYLLEQYYKVDPGIRQAVNKLLDL